MSRLPINGGYAFNFRGKPEDNWTTLPTPGAVTFSLVGPRGEAYEPLVAAGDQVQSGQPLARAAGPVAVPLLSPVTGKVTALQPNQPRGKRIKAGAISLENEGEDRWQAMPGGGINPAQVRAQSGRESLLAGGYWPLFKPQPAGSPFCDPTRFPAALVVVAIQTEPFLPAPGALVAAHPGEFAEGLDVMRALAGEETPVYLVVATDPPAEIAQAAAQRDWLKTVRLPALYPAEDPRLLYRILRRFHGLAPEPAAWFIDLAGMLAAAQGLLRGWPLVEMSLALGGAGFTAPGYVKARLGTPWTDVLKDRLGGEPARLIRGGLLRGELLGERASVSYEDGGAAALPEVTDRAFLGFLMPAANDDTYSRACLSAFRPGALRRASTDTHGEVRACINCGWCEEVCPAGIMPQLLHRAAYSKDLEEAEKLGLELCLDCGLCAYVCPVKLEILGEILHLKHRLHKERTA